MADITESAVSSGEHVAVSSLASFRALSTALAADGRTDTADMARVAAELLTDARRLRGVHGDAIVVAPSGSAEHELHVNLHACERAALAAQRRGVEALTARLRNDAELLASISRDAFGDLEAAAQALLAAASLSDQLQTFDAADGPPPPPTSHLGDGEVVLDVTRETADLAYRAADPRIDDELTRATEPFVADDWEARRSSIMERVEQVRRPQPEAIFEPEVIAESKTESRDDTISPIIAAALASKPLRSGRSISGLSPDSESGPDVDRTQPEPTQPSLASVPDLVAEDALVIDIADAPSAGADDDTSAATHLADVIELQTEATVHQWPIWKGPGRGTDEPVVTEVVSLPDTSADPVETADAPELGADGYPRLVSVAPAEPAPTPPPAPVATDAEPERPSLSFAPQAPAESDLLPVPFGPRSTGRKSQEEIAAEARALIADQQDVSSGTDTFSKREVRRRQRKLRSHQRAVEKAEGKVQRDRRRAELEHERSLAEEEHAATVSSSYAPTWFSQLAFAIAVCGLVVMVAVGLWFLLADDPGLF